MNYTNKKIIPAHTIICNYSVSYNQYILLVHSLLFSPLFFKVLAVVYINKATQHNLVQSFNSLLLNVPTSKVCKKSYCYYWCDKYKV